MPYMFILSIKETYILPCDFYMKETEQRFSIYPRTGCNDIF